jgi:hypothetical protein
MPMTALTKRQREEVACNGPACKNHSTKYTRKSANHDRAPPVEWLVLELASETTAHSERHTHRHSQTDQIGNQFRKLIAGIREFGHGVARANQQRQDSCRKNQPQEKGSAKSPNQSRTRTRSSVREEKAKGKPE